MTSIRAAAIQFGYLLGAAAGGVALALGGYPAVGAVLAALFLTGALPHLAISLVARLRATSAGDEALGLAPVR